MKHSIWISLVALIGGFSALAWNLAHHKPIIPAASLPADVNPEAVLAQLFPLICHWAAEQERIILRDGRPLNAAELADARALGVSHPERVRLLSVPHIPVPADPMLAQGARAVISTNTVGLTVRYGIYLRADLADDRELLAHELTHTRQYEQHGGIAAFLRQYLAECLFPPYYAHSPLEIEAAQAAAALVQ